MPFGVSLSVLVLSVVRCSFTNSGSNVVSSWCSLTTDAWQTLATAFVANRVDYCNAVLDGTSAVVIADYKWYSTPPLVSVNMSTSHRFFTTSSTGCQCLRGYSSQLLHRLLTASEAPGLPSSAALSAQLLTIQAVLVSAWPSVVFCSFHEPEQLGLEGGASSSQLQLSGTHCRFTFAPRPSVAVSFEQGSRLIFSDWPFTNFSSENY